jgi:hypothetical protein
MFPLGVFFKLKNKNRLICSRYHFGTHNWRKWENYYQSLKGKF